jgi:hypothetical protein
MKVWNAAAVAALALGSGPLVSAQEPSADLKAYSISARQPAMLDQCAAVGSGEPMERAFGGWSTRNADAVRRGRIEMQARLPAGHSLERYEATINRGIASSFARLSKDKRVKQCANYVISLNTR